MGNFVLDRRALVSTIRKHLDNPRCVGVAFNMPRELAHALVADLEGRADAAAMLARASDRAGKAVQDKALQAAFNRALSDRKVAAFFDAHMRGVKASAQWGWWLSVLCILMLSVELADGVCALLVPLAQGVM